MNRKILKPDNEAWRELERYQCKTPMVAAVRYRIRAYFRASTGVREPFMEQIREALRQWPDAYVYLLWRKPRLSETETLGYHTYAKVVVVEYDGIEFRTAQAKPNTGRGRYWMLPPPPAAFEFERYVPVNRLTWFQVQHTPHGLELEAGAYNALHRVLPHLPKLRPECKVSLHLLPTDTGFSLYNSNFESCMSFRRLLFKCTAPLLLLAIQHQQRDPAPPSTGEPVAKRARRTQSSSILSLCAQLPLDMMRHEVLPRWLPHDLCLTDYVGRELMEYHDRVATNRCQHIMQQHRVHRQQFITDWSHS